MGSAEIQQQSEKSRIWKRALVLLAFAICVRLLLLLVLYKITGGKEFADDFNAYRLFLKNPLVLFNGHSLDEEPDVIVYSPLIPIQVWFPGKIVCSLLGTFLGHRLCMIMYDSIAMLVTTYAMSIHFTGEWKRKHWLAGLLLMCVPGSIGACTLWGQEDSIAAMWTSFAMLALLRGHPTISALFGGIGLFTHKLFALLISWGIFVAAKPARLKIAITTGFTILIFFGFLYARFYFTGMKMDSYTYGAMNNSPSPWAMINRFMGDHPFSFEELKPYIVVTTIFAILLVSLPMRRGFTVPSASIIATHGTFFVVFIGIQPEHHQWFMPFLIYFAWQKFLEGDLFTLLLAWSFSGFAYAYKIAYGLSFRNANPTTAGKDIFRHWFGTSAAPIFSSLQILFHILTMLAGIVLVYRAVKTRHPVHATAPQST